eukprot:TRINITY_DN30345_c1_g1_i1.p1 TRINITY_DN30345_c1_g1~~TRINITY_DN30345_c1_g1_i1.p1  ORF type:complete len:101 (-),score=25.85 TRINITY_DN30345_c1_g1_i1:135-437(-)
MVIFATPSSLPITLRRSISAPELAIIEKAKHLAFMAEKRQLHQRGRCKPCSFFTGKGDGCQFGDFCKSCHLCTAEEVQEKKRLKRLNAAKAKRQEAAERS